MQPGWLIMNEDIQKKLNALYELYSKNLPNKIRSIESLWSALEKKWDETEFETFHREVHSLSGSSATYGYVGLSKASRQLELYLKNRLNQSKLDRGEKDHIVNLLNQLKNRLPKITSQPLEDTFTPTLERSIAYVMEQDLHVRKEIIERLKAINYSAYPIQNMTTLDMAIKEQEPTVLIINTDFLDKDGIQDVLAIQQEQVSPIPLVCIVPDETLPPRLDAIRAGCQSFFQKPVDIGQLVQVLAYKFGTDTGASYRILIVDDSESLGEYYKLILNQAGMIAESITNPLNLLEQLESFQPDLLIMDIYMPQCTGFELAVVLRLESNYTKIPIIFLSTEEDKNKKLFAISLGVDDFLTKPVSPQHLISAVRSRSKRASNLNYYMTTDSLTGLLNHSNILKKLEMELAHAKQNQHPLSFVMIDIDYFKAVNDNYGHPTGDEVLKKLSFIFMNQLRNRDSIGRYGGEEFALILSGADSANAERITNDLRLLFSQHVFNTDNDQFSVSFSAGIASFDGTQNIKTLLEQADQALYQAKQKGRNQVQVFNPILNQTQDRAPKHPVSK